MPSWVARFARHAFAIAFVCASPLITSISASTSTATDTRTAADAFRKAHEWLREQDVRLADVSWSHMDDEDQPYWLSVYFTFELDPEVP